MRQTFPIFSAPSVTTLFVQPQGSNAFIKENNDYNHFAMCKSISRHKVTQTKCRTQELEIVGKNFDVFRGHCTH